MFATLEDLVQATWPVDVSDVVAHRRLLSAALEIVGGSASANASIGAVLPICEVETSWLESMLQASEASVVLRRPIRWPGTRLFEPDEALVVVTVPMSILAKRMDIVESLFLLGVNPVDWFIFCGEDPLIEGSFSQVFVSSHERKAYFDLSHIPESWFSSWSALPEQSMFTFDRVFATDDEPDWLSGPLVE